MKMNRMIIYRNSYWIQKVPDQREAKQERNQGRVADKIKEKQETHIIRKSQVLNRRLGLIILRNQLT